MQMTVSCIERTLTIALKGELDHHGAKGYLERMESEVTLHTPSRLILDFSGITFMDSAGIAVALRSWQRMKEAGGTVELRNVAPQPMKVFHTAGVGRMMNIS